VFLFEFIQTLFPQVTFSKQEARQNMQKLVFRLLTSHSIPKQEMQCPYQDDDAAAITAAAVYEQKRFDLNLQQGYTPHGIGQQREIHATRSHNVT